MRCLLLCLLVVAGGLGGQPARGQPVIDPVEDLFTPRPPLPAGTREQPIGPLRLPDASVRGTGASGVVLARPPAPQAAGPRQPAFALNDGDRVLFLGDAILEAEAEHGYLEARLEIQYPASRLVFRNLSASPHNRLRNKDPRRAAEEPGWLTDLTAEVRAVRPNVIFLSCGTATAWEGAATLSAFSNVVARLVEGVLAPSPGPPPRVVMLGPLSYEPPPGGHRADVTKTNEVVADFVDTTWQISTNHHVEFVDLFLFSRNEVLTALGQAEAGGPATPRLTGDGGRPTAYGLWRLAFALERGLRWTPTNWRFGLMGDGQWRPGGFGARIASHTRTDAHVRVVFTEERLPLPNPPGAVDLIAEDRPQRYIQIRNLKEGRYDLRVDGQTVVQGTHSEWNRFEIIAQGPSWDQAERLRQTIVKKNALAAQSAPPAGAGLGGRADADPRVAELEAEIARLKQPVQRVYEIVRTGDAPPDATPRLLP